MKEKGPEIKKQPDSYDNREKIKSFGFEKPEDLDKIYEEMGLEKSFNEKENWTDITDGSLRTAVNNLQNALITNTEIKEHFSDQLDLLQDGKFGPVTFQALQMMRRKNLRSDIITETALRKPDAKTKAKSEVESDTAITRSAEQVQDAVSGRDGNLRYDVRGGEQLWTIGSSSAFSLDKYTGYGTIGQVGASPGKLLSVLKEQWNKWGHLKMPKKAVLVGTALNGLPNDSVSAKVRESKVEQCVNDYLKLAKFLKSKGVEQVYCTTIQPYQKRSKAVAMFNDRIKREQGNDLKVIDFAGKITTADNNWKKDMVSGDGIHMSKKGYQVLAGAITGQAA